MSIEKVKAFFAARNLSDRIMEFAESSATVALAAKAAGCEEKEIAKSMAFLVGGEPILVVMAGDARIANPKFKAVFHEKPKMIPPEKLGELIGHEMGGVCPFAVKEGVKIYLDISLKRFNYIYPAAGSEKSAVKLTPTELEEITAAHDWVDIGKDWADA